MIKRLLLSALNKTKRVGRHLESRLNAHTPADQIFDATKAPVIGYDVCLKGNNKGRALICYLTEPFYYAYDSPEIHLHQNMARSVEIAKVFNRIGYISDIVHLYDTKFVPQCKYNILFGFGPAFARIAQQVNDSVIKIYLAAEPYPEFRIKAEQKRIHDIKDRRGISLPIMYPSKCLSYPNGNKRRKKLIDVVVAIGNSWVASTYSPFCKRVHSIGDGGFDFLQSTIEEKDFANARYGFMWMGDWLFAMKGLDLVLEAFRRLPEYKLYVCGALWNDPAFMQAYEQELFHSPNIRFMGRMNLRFDEFKNLTRLVCYNIFPTSNDAAAGSVWAPMHCGVIPISSKENGMDIEKFGITLPDCSLETIVKTIEKAVAKKPEDCKNMAKQAYQESKNNYTIKEWSNRLMMVLKQYV